jgi:glutamate 5-kinase
MRDIKSWTRHTLFPSGSVIIDSGTHRILSRRELGGRLLLLSVLRVIETFASRQAIRIVIHRRRGSDSDGGTEDTTVEHADFVRICIGVVEICYTRFKTGY